MQEEKLYPRRWGILAALFFALLFLQFTFIVPGGAALAIMEHYQISPMLFTMVMSVPYLSGILFGVFSGTLADRIGVRRVILVGYALALIGVVWRALSGTSFIMLFISSFVMGFATAVLNANSAKIIRRWFPGKSNSVAMGVYVAAASLGAGIALNVGARVSLEMSWWISVCCIVAAIVFWLILYREHPEGELKVEESVKEHLGTVLKNKSVWGISVFAFLFMGLTVVGTSYMVAGMTLLGGTPESAGEAANISTINTLFVCASSIFLPAVIARFKRIRLPLTILLIGTGLFYGISLFVPLGPITYVIFILAAIFVGPIMSMVKTMPALLPNVKQEHLGAVGGVQSMFQNFGMFLVSSYIVAPIATLIDPAGSLLYYQAAFALFAVGCVICIILLFTFPNLRTNVADVILDKQRAEEEGQAALEK